VAAHGVLVVDDQEVVRTVMLRTLERAGYRVLVASTPNEAIELARADSARIDLLITDVVMPQMDAFELAGRVSAMLPAIRVLYTSGYTNAAAEGPFLRKPFSPDELLEKVGALLADVGPA
jgi:two-component system cell cycle sensor histidine kinase/response regulator CckA